MPAYDYRCTACGDVFEVNRAIGKASDECCPECGAPAKRVFTPVGVQFKGSGFHNTDYKAKSSGASGSDSGAAKSCPAAKEGPSACAGCPSASE